MMQNNFSKTFGFLATFLLTLFYQSAAFANCSCVSNNGITILGREYMAKSFAENPCPETGSPVSDVNEIEYTYRVIESTECIGGQVKESLWNFGEDDWDYTPARIEQDKRNSGFYNNFRTIRNKSGTHILFVHKYFQGTIAGIYLPYNGPPITYITADGAFDDYCSSDVTFSPPDYNGDDDADCMDCLPEEAGYEGVCTESGPKREANFGAFCPVRIP